MSTEIIKNPSVVITIPNSEAIIKNQQKGISDSWVTGYYSSDKKLAKSEIVNFFNNFDNDNVFKIDIKKTKNYADYVSDNIYSKKDKFKDELKNYKENITYFNTNNDDFIQMGNFSLSENGDNRYIKMPYNTNEPAKKLTNILLGNVSVLVITKISEKEFVVYPSIQVSSVLDDYNIDGQKSKIGKNILLYGVPGCGKSHTIKEEYCNDEDYMERIVFHPDYSYSDFVGQILPRSTKDSSTNEYHIDYPFVPGPFTKILDKAVNDSKKHSYYLVIEEINRGNAPAIFGDVFQLLDRKDDGESVYAIKNEEIAKIVYKDENKKVKIPSNLFIIATMNTADQNVFTLDTAFKRRWTMRCINNDIDDCAFAEKEVCETKVTWKEFVTKINKLIIKENEKYLGSEDKRIGAYFINENDLDDLDAFAEKVLMYLWNDAFKFSKKDVFDFDLLSNENTVENLIEKYKEVGFDIFIKKDLFEKNAKVEDEYPEVDSKYLETKKGDMVNIYNEIKGKIISKLKRQ